MRIPILPCASSTLKGVQLVVIKALHVNLCIQSYARACLDLESVIIIAVISITLLVLLGLTICRPPVIPPPPNKMHGPIACLMTRSK